MKFLDNVAHFEVFNSSEYFHTFVCKKKLQFWEAKYLEKEVQVLEKCVRTTHHVITHV